MFTARYGLRVYVYLIHFLCNGGFTVIVIPSFDRTCCYPLSKNSISKMTEVLT